VSEQNHEASKTVKLMYNQMKELEATDAHFVAEKIFKDEEACSVISVYQGLKPDHMVVEELSEWAEANGNQELLDKINVIRSDISFMSPK
jgi:hypothetical protein